MTETPPLRDLGWTPAGFALPATDGRTLTLDDIRGARGTLVMFICNHCPYVLAVLDRLKDDTRTLIAEGIGVAAICSNDAVTHPADSFERYKLRFSRCWLNIDCIYRCTTVCRTDKLQFEYPCIS